MMLFPSQRRGQAMLETVLAVLFVTFILLVAFQLMHMLTSRILLDYAAARAARARAVGFNDFMCLKSARAAIIPVSGRRTWPESAVDEVARIPIYLASESPARARGILDYERWDTSTLFVSSGLGIAPVVKAHMRMAADNFTMDGEAEVESHFPFYMEKSE